MLESTISIDQGANPERAEQLKREGYLRLAGDLWNPEEIDRLVRIGATREKYQDDLIIIQNLGKIANDKANLEKLIAILDQGVAVLPERTADVIKQYYDLNGTGTRFTLKEITENSEPKVSKSRISQLRLHGLSKMNKRSTKIVRWTFQI
jgi:DNA-directed RNA polymerase specialized sigma subunit